MEVTQDKYAQLQQVIDEYKDQQGPLMPVMQAAQEIFGCLPQDVQEKIADGLNITLSDVYGVATFYSQFALAPKGTHVINVCMGTACYVKGAQAVLDKLSESLGVKPGGTTADGKFTLQATRCIGACGLAPVIMVDEDVHGRLSPEDVPAILAKYED
ncbi:MAG: NADH-quinone oxidoreductase subunit NuoE [Clostridiales bacterium]|jgi:NADH:ubiquinone oxidoreductase subunit E|nr:NADH-quinone oxidoreductase subunit NuoE [Clostridiales bacterium]